MKLNGRQNVYVSFWTTAYDECLHKKHWMYTLYFTAVTMKDTNRISCQTTTVRDKAQTVCIILIMHWNVLECCSDQAEKNHVIFYGISHLVWSMMNVLSMPTHIPGTHTPTDRFRFHFMSTTFQYRRDNSTILANQHVVFLISDMTNIVFECAHPSILSLVPPHCKAIILEFSRNQFSGNPT